MSYKLINTTTGEVKNCYLMSISRKLEPNTVLAEYNAAGVLLASYPISSLDICQISVDFAEYAINCSREYLMSKHIKFDNALACIALCRAWIADSGSVTWGELYRAANAATDGNISAPLRAADNAANICIEAECFSHPVLKWNKEYLLNALAEVALNNEHAHRYADGAMSIKKREYTRQGQFILDYLRAGSNA